MSSFSDCQKHEEITVKTLQGDEDTLSNITHGLMTYDCKIVWY